MGKSPVDASNTGASNDDASERRAKAESPVTGGSWKMAARHVRHRTIERPSSRDLWRHTSHHK